MVRETAYDRFGDSPYLIAQVDERSSDPAVFDMKRDVRDVAHHQLLLRKPTSRIGTGLGRRAGLRRAAETGAPFGTIALTTGLVGENSFSLKYLPRLTPDFSTK